MTSRTDVASQLRPLFSDLFGTTLPLRLRAWDGSEAGPTGAPVVVLRHPMALRRILWSPNDIGLARAFVSGDLDFEGDLFDALRTAQRVIDEAGIESRSRRGSRLGMLRAALRLGVVGPPPRPPAEEVGRLPGRKHSRTRDAAAVRHHYDVGNDFYRHVLGPSMVYSCAYWAQPEADGYTLEDAQRDKCELICRKLGLTAGARLLDVGCGWGSLVVHAARAYGVKAVGVTVSPEQAELARRRAAEAGVDDLVEIRLQDYREVDDGPYDAIASVGMAEHVGIAAYRSYADTLYGLLRPGGRVLNHQITRQGEPADPDERTFIQAYVFPDGELLSIGTVTTVLERSGLEVRDVESLREHYARTLRHWSANLDTHWDECARLTSVGRARVWRLYMAAAALAFEAGKINLHQVLAIRPGPDGHSGLPSTRDRWLGVG